MNDVRVWLKKRLEKKLHYINFVWLHLCKLETCIYISLAAIYGLTAITKILVAGWKYARFLCYSMGAHWFLRILGPKLELPRSSAYSPYLRCLWSTLTDRHSPMAKKKIKLAKRKSHTFANLRRRWRFLFRTLVYGTRQSVSCTMIHIPRWAKCGGISDSCMESYDVKRNFYKNL